MICPPSATQVLAAHRENQKLVHLTLETPSKDEDLVFSRIDGTPLRPNSISRAWVMLAPRTNVKVIPFHDARHSHAIILFKLGVHPKIVQERLGHSTTTTSMDICCHATRGLQAAVA